ASYHPLPARSLTPSFFLDPATTHTSTLSLHDALPISAVLPFPELPAARPVCGGDIPCRRAHIPLHSALRTSRNDPRRGRSEVLRSEEHTSELQSRFDLVCRLLLEKKKKKTIRD